MTKRLISAILVLALTLSAVILPVNADEKVLTATKINLMYDGSVDEVSVYRYGDDIYFSGEDLFAYTYYDYENDGKKAVFTRGAKEVIINLSDDEFTVKAAGLDTDWKWNNPPVKIDGEWYFSGADLLPWLNVKCGNDGGCLAIIPDEWSYWDVYEQLDVFSYNISYSSVCMELSWDSKVVKALKCTDDNLGEMILEGVNIEDEYGGNASDYYDILEGFLLEKSSTAKVADQIHKYVNYGLDVLGILIDGYDEIFTAFELYSDGALYASNYVAFTHDNNNKMEVIDMIFTTTGGEGKEGTQQLNDGANLIKVAYSSWWNNIITNYILNLDEKLIDKIKDGITAGNPLINALLMAVDVATEESRSLNKRIKLMPCYLNIYSLGVDLLDGNQSSHIVLLESSLDTLNISLYAAAENARTLSEYCEDKELYGLAEKYASQANDAEGWREIINSISLNIVNDSIHYYNEDGEPDQDVYKDAYTKELLKLFGEIDYCGPVGSLTSTVEYAMLHTFIMKQGVSDATWKIQKYEDGYDLYVLYSLNSDFTEEDYNLCFTADASTKNARANATNQSAEYENPNLSDFTVSGEPEKIYSKLDSHFESRHGFVTSEIVDLNGDGKEDKIYCVANAMNQWKQRYDLGSSCSFNPFGNVGYVTLVVAEQADSGVRIRVTHFAATNEKSYTISGGVITNGSREFRYQPEGEVFMPVVPDEEIAKIPLANLLLLTPEEVKNSTLKYEEWSSDEEDIYADAYYGDVPLELHFELIDNVFRLTDLKIVFTESEIAIIKNITSKTDVQEAMDFFQPTYSWNLTHSKSEGDSAHYYRSSFYYSAEDSTVWNVIIDDRNIWDDEESRWSERVLGGIQFIYSKSLSENVPDWLKNS